MRKVWMVSKETVYVEYLSKISENGLQFWCTLPLPFKGTCTWGYRQLI